MVRIKLIPEALKHVMEPAAGLVLTSIAVVVSLNTTSHNCKNFNFPIYEMLVMILSSSSNCCSWDERWSIGGFGLDKTSRW